MQFRVFWTNNDFFAYQHGAHNCSDDINRKASIDHSSKSGPPQGIPEGGILAGKLFIPKPFDDNSTPLHHKGLRSAMGEDYFQRIRKKKTRWHTRHTGADGVEFFRRNTPKRAPRQRKKKSDDQSELGDQPQEDAVSKGQMYTSNYNGYYGTY